jgi:hypothetical protein
MKSRLIFLLLLGALALLPACTLYGDRPVVNHWADATGGIGFERSFWEDVKTKSWDDLSHHIGGNYEVMTPEGKLDRATALDRLQRFHIDDYLFENVHSELNGSTFVVTYQLVLRGTFNDKPISSTPVGIMTVWQQQSKGWMTIARSEMGSWGNEK